MNLFDQIGNFQDKNTKMIKNKLFKLDLKHSQPQLASLCLPILSHSMHFTSKPISKQCGYRTKGLIGHLNMVI